jgi:hypothetical protein
MDVSFVLQKAIASSAHAATSGKMLDSTACVEEKFALTRQLRLGLAISCNS